MENSGITFYAQQGFVANRESRKIVIVGGGVIGLSVAYHLGKLGADDVLLLERNQLTSGTSWHAAGIVGPLRASMNMTRIAAYASELLPQLEVETGQSTGYRQTGGYWLARTQDRLHALRRVAAIGEMTGIEAEIVSATELAIREPYLRTDDLAGALYVPTDAQANPVDICMAYAKSARGNGIELREHTDVTAIHTQNGAVHSVQLTGGETIRCDKLINCAGVWAHHIGVLAGVPIPLQAVEHMYVVTEPVTGLPTPYPVMRDLDRGTYIKGDAGRLLIGGFEANAKPWPANGPQGNHAFLEMAEDWDQFEPFMTAALERLPVLADTGIQHFMNGPESFTPDSRQLLGESPFLKHFFVAAGMNSTGMMSSAGVGRVMAEWLMNGEPSMDLWAVDIARFDRHVASPVYLKTRMQEAVADVFAMHWPHQQALAGRNLRRSTLHQVLSDNGAFFGAPTGWERPLWFAKTPAEHTIHYSYKEQNWWPAAQRECDAMRDRVALLELSPFTKLDIAGNDALALLQYTCANDVDIAIGQTVYGQFLNRHGGIEADVTIARHGETTFRVISGAATRYRDQQWLHRQRDTRPFNASVFDATSTEAVLGVVGPHARALLQSLSSVDLSKASFPFATTQLIDIGNAIVRAMRVSFSGELGWELYIPTEWALTVYHAIIDAGRQFDLLHAGHLALDACRIEKGFCHWGHDIGPRETPLEAGLDFAVAWDKPDEFSGQAALLEQRKNCPGQRLLSFAIDTAHPPILLHDEPIYSDGQLLGHTTSGGRGFRTGKTLCMAYIACEPSTSKQHLLGKHYEIAVAGKRYPLQPLAQAAYDPDGTRMRG